MRILFLGDVVGRAARKAVMEQLPILREEFRADFIIVNVENAAGGFGITPAIADEFLKAGADAMTTGNHVWDKREIFDYIEKDHRLLRPQNMPPGTPGKGAVIVLNDAGMRLGLANMMCNLFMAEYPPAFTALAEILAELRLVDTVDALLIDIHGEATSEKMALGLAADGHASLVVGTHTHVPTADTRILPRGTGYQSDAGMCGCYDSIIGMDPEAAMARFFEAVPGGGGGMGNGAEGNGTGKKNPRLEPAKGEVTICGVLVETDDATGLARSITRISRGGFLQKSG